MSGEPLATARRYRSGMRRQFGALFHVLGLSLLLRRMRLEDHSAEEIRRAAERGPIVYVLHTRHWYTLTSAPMLALEGVAAACFVHTVGQLW